MENKEVVNTCIWQDQFWTFPLESRKSLESTSIRTELEADHQMLSHRVAFDQSENESIRGLCT